MRDSELPLAKTGYRLGRYRAIKMIPLISTKRISANRRRRTRTSSCGEARNTSRCIRPTPSVVAAHDRSYLHMKILIRLARLAQNAVEHPVENDELLIWASEGRAGRRSAGWLPVGWARLRPPPCSTTDATQPCSHWCRYIYQSGHPTMVCRWGCQQCQWLCSLSQPARPVRLCAG